jgi:sirohydrochlorin cobaltochelatase
MICGHGSRNRFAVAEFAQLAEQLRERLHPLPVAHGYLEFARPILREGLESLRGQGVSHILALPAMLFAAAHAKNDIPSVLNAYAAETGLTVEYGRELGVDLGMIQAAGSRIRASLEEADSRDRAAGRTPPPVHDTLLVVVGRGSSDPDANSNVAKVTRMLVEGFGFGWGETLYSGVTFPLVEPGLRQVMKLGYKRIVVLPYFLFSGVLVSRIAQHSALVAADHPDVEVLQTSYLGDHPQVLQTFEERLLEVMEGTSAMNCSLCKYRAQVLGFEREVGLPQHSHHHHVEGSMESCDLCVKECTGACQPDGLVAQHDHGEGVNLHAPHAHADPHAPEASPLEATPDTHDHHAAHHPAYPHANHPLGPRTLRRT